MTNVSVLSAAAANHIAVICQLPPPISRQSTSVKPGHTQITAEDGKTRIDNDKFDGHDFVFWKMQIEDYLYEANLYLPLSGQKPKDMIDSDWDLMDRPY